MNKPIDYYFTILQNPSSNIKNKLSAYKMCSSILQKYQISFSNLSDINDDEYDVSETNLSSTISEIDASLETLDTNGDELSFDRLNELYDIKKKLLGVKKFLSTKKLDIFVSTKENNIIPINDEMKSKIFIK